jgi:uncharacterized protein YbjT (DUF2867 family)
MKIVVIGGTGLIGSKLIALLTAQGATGRNRPSPRGDRRSTQARS